jgi:hypothetical protein
VVGLFNYPTNTACSGCPQTQSLHAQWRHQPWYFALLLCTAVEARPADPKAPTCMSARPPTMLPAMIFWLKTTSCRLRLMTAPPPGIPHCKGANTAGHKCYAGFTSAMPLSTTAGHNLKLTSSCTATPSCDCSVHHAPQAHPVTSGRHTRLVIDAYKLQPQHT